MRSDISQFEVRPPLDKVFSSPQEAFRLFEKMDGDVVRDVANRKTTRFKVGENAYFLKWHEPIGWRETIKNIVRLRLPVIGAKTEWCALNLLRGLGIACPYPVAYGETRSMLFQQQSFIITEEIPDAIELDHFFRQTDQLGEREKFKWRLAAVKSVALIVKKMHEAGVNHRDLYLCHFLLKSGFVRASLNEIEIAVIDLHRAQIRNTVPHRWLIKDLAALYFSAFDLPVSRSHIFRFIRLYFGLDLRTIFISHQVMFKDIESRAIKFYIRDNKKQPKLPI